MKAKRLLSFLFIIVCLVAFAVPSFATDVIMDGTDGNVTPLVSFTPIKYFTIRAYYAAGTNDLDNFMFSTGGFFHHGQIDQEIMIIDYTFADTQVTKTITRPYYDDVSTTVKESFEVSGNNDDFLFCTGFEVYIYFEDFWVNRLSTGNYPMMVSPSFFINAPGSGDDFRTTTYQGAQVYYTGSYRRAQFNDSIIASDRVDFDYQRENFTYSDLTQYTGSVQLLPVGLFDAIYSNATGNSDSFNGVFIVEDLVAKFRFIASTDVLNFVKKFGLMNYYYTQTYYDGYVSNTFGYPEFSYDVDAIISDGPVFIDEIPVGEFLDNSIGPFLDTEIFGWFSIGDMIGATVGLALLFAFLRFFAGG